MWFLIMYTVAFRKCEKTKIPMPPWLTNTLLVMNLIFVFFRDAYASANGVAAESVYGFILTIIGINGIPEAIVAAILTALIGRILLKANIHKGGAL